MTVIIFFSCKVVGNAVIDSMTKASVHKCLVSSKQNKIELFFISELLFVFKGF